MVQPSDIQAHVVFMVDSDTEEPWFPMPLGEKHDDWRENWAGECARAMLLLHGERPKRRNVKKLRDWLVDFSRLFSSFPAHYAYLFAPEPGKPPHQAFAVVSAIEGDRETELRTMVRGNAEELSHPFAPEAFPGGRLGEGMRAVNRWHDREAGPMISVRYGWRVEESGVDVVFYVVGHEVDFITAHLADFDAYARTLYLKEL
ncbi:hypothetical protein GCM10009801_74060 [Streptomyces albiaxialis]|uniref:Uncharacterized protein n=1 Tax=Streptomyces albiaxialis TaxID=329523 RepID=A0ABP5IIM9_9ACTN